MLEEEVEPDLQRTVRLALLTIRSSEAVETACSLLHSTGWYWHDAHVHLHFPVARQITRNRGKVSMQPGRTSRQDYVKTVQCCKEQQVTGSTASNDRLLPH